MNEPGQGNPEEQKSDELANGPAGRPDMGTQKFTIVKNSDKDSVLPWGNLGFAVVDEVNGPSAAEIVGYVPTGHELIHLVKYWYGRILHDYWSFFVTSQTGTSEFRLRCYAEWRIGLAAAAIGQEPVDQAIQDVRDKFKAMVNDAPLWDIFENGTAEQWDAVQDETYREWREQDVAEALKRLEQLQSESRDSLIALVLHGWSEGKGRAVLISASHSELNAVLHASGKFGIETDVSRLRTLILEQHFRFRGILRATRHNGEWLFGFPDSSPGTIGWLFLESVAGDIKELWRAGGERR
jgi:hypothetical protein